MISRRQLLLLAAAFFAARVLLVLCAADRLSEPDAAETKLMQLGDEWVRSGEAPSLDGMLRLARSGTNAPHGAYLPVSLLYALLLLPFGAPSSYLALKLVAILFATAAFAIWTTLASELGGRRTGLAAALLLFLPPPSFLAGSLVAWGSHPESAFFVGLAALLALRCWRQEGAIGPPLLAGLAMALAVGMNLLTAPLIAVLALGWALDGRRQTRGLIAGSSAALLLLLALLSVTRGTSASVTESAGASPTELARTGGGGGGSLTLETLDALLPPSLVAAADRASSSAVADAADWALLIVLVFALVILAREGWQFEDSRARVMGLFLAGPLIHLTTLAILAPRRPYVPPRYLLPLLPVLLVGLALAWGRSGAYRRVRVGLAAGLALWVLPGLVAQARLFEPARMASFPDYRPSAYLAHDIGHVSYESAPAVNRFLEAREGTSTAGFNFASGMGASDDLVMEDAERESMDPRALLDRRDDWLAHHPLDGEERRQLHQNIGWGMTIFAPGRKGVWHAVLSHLPPDDRGALAEGLGMALGLGEDQDCALLRDLGGPDREAVLRGLGSLGPAARCQQQD